MRSYAQLFAMAATRKGGAEALEALLPKAESPEALAHWQEFVIEAVLRTVRP